MVVVARGMAAKTGKGGAAGGKKKGGVVEIKESKGEHGLGVVPINYLKDGTDPSIKQDEEYPEWLWSMQVCHDVNIFFVISFFQRKNPFFIRDQHIDRVRLVVRVCAPFVYRSGSSLAKDSTTTTTTITTTATNQPPPPWNSPLCHFEMPLTQYPVVIQWT